MYRLDFTAHYVRISKAAIHQETKDLAESAAFIKVGEGVASVPNPSKFWQLKPAKTLKLDGPIASWNLNSMLIQCNFSQ